MTDIITKLLKAMIVFAAYLYVNTTAYAVQITNNNPWPPASFVNYANTHLPIELKSMSSDSHSYKVASVCDVGSGECLEKFKFDESQTSTNTNKCSTGYVYFAGQGCILDKCPAGSYENVCPSSLPIQSGTVKAASGRNCYQCRAEECSAYPLTTCPANANCSDCPDNSAKKKVASCTADYKVSGNSCVSKVCPTDFSCNGTESCVSGICKDDSCPTGYQKSNECKNGIEDSKNNAANNSCYKCKTCPNLGNLTSCPSGAVCTFEECSGKYYETGCGIGSVKVSETWCSSSDLRCFVEFEQDCVTLPSCAEIGYNKTAFQCSGRDMMRCPFDTTQVSCGATIGDIYYSDGTFSPDKVSGKTAIGIIFWLNSDSDAAAGNRALVMALDNPKKAWSNANGMGWWVTDTIPSIPDKTAALADYKGMSNTAAMIAFKNTHAGSTFEAAEYCTNYSTTGTVKGKWFLPSLGQMQYIYNTKAQINATLTLLGKPQLATGYHWSSTEASDAKAWMLHLDAGYTADAIKNYDYDFRPVLAL